MKKYSDEDWTECFNFLSRLDYSSLTSAAELELHAAVAGIAIDDRISWGWIVPSLMFDTAFKVMLSGIWSGTFSSFTDKTTGPELVFSTVANLQLGFYSFKRLKCFASDDYVLDFLKRLYKQVSPVDMSLGHSEIISRNVEDFMRIVFIKSPLTIFRMYQRFESEMHSSAKYTKLLVYMSKLVFSIKDDSKYRKLRDAFQLDYTQHMRQNMFMR